MNADERVTPPDFRAVFEAAPGVQLVLAPDSPRFTMLAASDERLIATLTTREATIGRPLFDVFSDANPENPEPSGVENLRASLETVLRTRAPHQMAVQRYDLRRPDGEWEVRYWAPRNVPVYAELLDMGIHGPVTKEQRAALERIQRSQRALLSVINEVLNYARLETGSVTYELADVRVADAVAAAEVLVAPQLREKGLVYRWDACEQDFMVRADSDKLQQVLLNLLSNAIKFTDARGAEPGRIDVSCASTADGARVLIRVRDTGVGIPSDKLDSVFEPFVQVDQRLTRTHSGTGLGLAISRDLARGMDGDLVVESELGAGSTFTLVLPAAASPARR